MPRTDRAYLTSRSSPLAALRVRAGLTRAAAADRLDISTARVSNVEHGVRASEELIAEMAEAYGVSLYAVRRAYVASRRDFIMREKP